jgi:hypothetical protein
VRCRPQVGPLRGTNSYYLLADSVQWLTSNGTSPALLSFRVSIQHVC